MAPLTYTAGDVRLYAVGFVSASACYPKDMPLEDVVAGVNFHAGPTGLGHGWTAADDPTFATGQPNPCECHDDPTRLHRLFHC